MLSRVRLEAVEEGEAQPERIETCRERYRRWRVGGRERRGGRVGGAAAAKETGGVGGREEVGAKRAWDAEEKREKFRGRARERWLAESWRE